MAWSGGTFSRVGGNSACANDEASSIGITSANMDTRLTDLATGINATLCKDGTNTPTADLAMGGYKHTNVADATALTNYAKVSQVQNNAYVWGGTSGGSANAQTLTCSPAPAALATGMAFDFLAGFSNTGSTTLNVNAIGAKTIYKDFGKTLEADDLIAGSLYRVIYDGTTFYLVGRSDMNRFISSGTTVTVTNTSGESSLLSFSVPGKTLGTTRAVRLTAFCRFTNTSGGNVTATLRAKWGGVTQITDALVAAGFASAALTTYQIKVEFTIQGGGATNAQRLSMVSCYTTTGGTTLGQSVPCTVNCGQASTALDSTAAQTVELSVQLNAISVNTSFTCVSYATELL